MEEVRKKLGQIKESLVRLGRGGVSIECGFFCYPFTVDEIQALIDAVKLADPKPSDVLAALADDLLDAVPLVRSDPDEADTIVDRLEDRVIRCGIPKEDEDRLQDNLYVARKHIRSAPEILESYLHTTAFEIRDFADQWREEGK